MTTHPPGRGAAMRFGQRKSLYEHRVNEPRRGRRPALSALSEWRGAMGKVIAQAMMSLDGYIAKDDNTIGGLFDWLQNGQVELVSPRGDRSFHLTPQSAEHMRHWIDSFGVLVCGRTLFDFTDGWDGRHDFDVPVVVVTPTVPVPWVDAHRDAPFSFVTDGVEAAIAHAQHTAGDRGVNVTAGVIAGQCLELGLLDEA